MEQADIIFVASEVCTLHALQRAIRARCNQWSFAFCESPEAAQPWIRTNKPWAVVCEYSLSENAGAAFLEQVRDLSPETIRIIISGDIREEAFINAAHVAHFLIAKPFDFDVLLDILERAYCLHSFALNEPLRQQIGKLEKLPVLPDIYQSLNQYLQKTKEPDTQVIAAIVEKDIVVLSKIIQFANSSFFGFSYKVTNSNDAVVRLGIDLTKALVLHNGLFYSSSGSNLNNNNVRVRSENIANQMVSFAKNLNESKPFIDQAYTVGLVHDIGSLVLEDDNALADAKHLVSAYVLKLWGFDDILVEAVMAQKSLSHLEKPTLLQILLFIAVSFDELKSSPLAEPEQEQLRKELLSGVDHLVDISAMLCEHSHDVM